MLLVSKQTKRSKFLKDRKQAGDIKLKERKQSKTPEGARVFPQERAGKVQAGTDHEDSLGIYRALSGTAVILGLFPAPSINKQSSFKSEEILSTLSALSEKSSHYGHQGL